MNWLEVNPWFHVATDEADTRIVIYSFTMRETPPNHRWVWTAKATNDAQPGINTITGWAKTLREAKTASESA